MISSFLHPTNASWTQCVPGSVLVAEVMKIDAALLSLGRETKSWRKKDCHLGKGNQESVSIWKSLAARSLKKWIENGEHCWEVTGCFIGAVREILCSPAILDWLAKGYDCMHSPPSKGQLIAGGRVGGISKLA